MKNMNKKIICIKPINIDDQLEDKINKNIPIKTEESISYFKNNENPNFNLNDNYFQIIRQRDCLPLKNNKLEKTVQLNNIIKIKAMKNNDVNEKCLLRKNQYNNYNINPKIHNFDKETIKKIVNQRKFLHKIYAKDKRIINHSYKNTSPSKNENKSYKHDKYIDSLTIHKNKNQYNKINITKNNNKAIKNRKKNKVIKLGLYDPTSRSLKYKHYSDNFNNSIRSIFSINNSSSSKYNQTIELNTNRNIYHLDNFNNTISFNEINNNFNESLIKHRKENQQNLIRLKKLLFNNKRINYYIKKNEESKSDTTKNEKDIYKININEKIKNIINHERKKLEKSIDAYNQKLEMNFNKKNILFKNYDMTKYKTEMGESKENEYLFDNMNIIADFHFQRENKL